MLFRRKKNPREGLRRDVESALSSAFLSSEKKMFDFPKNDFPASRTHCFVSYDGQWQVRVDVGGPATGGSLTVQMHRDPDGRKKDAREIAAIVAAIVHPEA